jgi:dTDP-4-dehydrorhamnose 3,5-epimerase
MPNGAQPETSVTDQSLNPVQIITPRRHGDERGWFMETWSARAFQARGLSIGFVQDNHSHSRHAGVIRGLHFQSPPFAQAKLVRCVRGAIFDVAVDLRKASASYGRWVGRRLTAENAEQMFIPEGFAHGFMTLEPETEVIYKVSAPYAPAHDQGLRWNDPDIAISWPQLPGVTPMLSPKDRDLGALAQFESPFADDGRPLLPLSD